MAAGHFVVVDQQLEELVTVRDCNVVVVDKDREVINPRLLSLIEIQLEVAG